MKKFYKKEKQSAQIVFRVLPKMASVDLKSLVDEIKSHGKTIRGMVIGSVNFHTLKTRKPVRIRHLPYEFADFTSNFSEYYPGDDHDMGTLYDILPKDHVLVEEIDDCLEPIVDLERKCVSLVAKSLFLVQDKELYRVISRNLELRQLQHQLAEQTEKLERAQRDVLILTTNIMILRQTITHLESRS
jgi:hypothetical protein